jgi:hypothetical protein
MILRKDKSRGAKRDGQGKPTHFHGNKHHI